MHMFRILVLIVLIVTPFASAAVSCHQVIHGHTYDLSVFSLGHGKNFECDQSSGCSTADGDIYFNFCHLTIDDKCTTTSAAVCLLYPNGSEFSGGNVNSQKFIVFGDYLLVQYDNGDPCNTESGAEWHKRTQIHCRCDTTTEDLHVINGSMSDGDCHYDVYVSSKYCCYRPTDPNLIVPSQGGGGGFVGAHAGVPTTFYVETRDEFGVQIYNVGDDEKFDFWLWDPYTGYISLNVSKAEEDPVQSGRYKVAYTTTKAGEFRWNATYEDHHLLEIENRTCTIYSAALDPASSHASGPGVGGQPGPWEAGKELRFRVYLYDIYGNPIDNLGVQQFQILIAGEDVPEFVKPNCDEFVDHLNRTNVYECNYVAPKPGTYYITIRIGMNSHHYAIAGSPYRIVISAGGIDWMLYVTLGIIVVMIVGIIVSVVVGSVLLWFVIERQKNRSEEYEQIEDETHYETPSIALQEPGMESKVVSVTKGQEVDESVEES